MQANPHFFVSGHSAVAIREISHWRVASNLIRAELVVTMRNGETVIFGRGAGPDGYEVEKNLIHALKGADDQHRNR